MEVEGKLIWNSTPQFQSERKHLSLQIQHGACQELVEGTAEFHQQTVNLSKLSTGLHTKTIKFRKASKKFLSNTIMKHMLRFTGIH